MLPLAVGRISGSPLTTSALHYFLPPWALTITSKMVSEITARVYVRIYGRGCQNIDTTISFSNLNLLLLVIVGVFVPVRAVLPHIPDDYRPNPVSIVITGQTIILVILLAINKKVLIIKHCYPISNNDLLSFNSLNIFQDRCSCPAGAMEHRTPNVP